MSTNKPNLSIVDSETEPKEVTPIDAKDIDTLNIDKLKETMVKNIYVVEAALFQQAGFEYKRVNNARNILDILEGELFSPNNINNLTVDQKIKLYNNLSQNMSKSLEFLGHLHDNVTSGLDTINKIEKLKNESDTVKRANETAGSNVALEDIKKLVLNKIKEKAVNK